MAGSVFDSALFGDLFPTGEVGRLFTDTAEVRAMLLVEGTLAKIQGQMGLIPEISAQAIHRASLELQIDPAGLRAATGANGVSVPGLVSAFRDLMQAPEHAQYAHWGATSQDIIDTALMLRLRQALSLIEKDLAETLSTLATLAETHAETPMAARTFGQYATPTSFGAVVASWGQPLLTLLRELPDLRTSCLLVSLSGAAGTASALGSDAAALRAKLAEGLRLQDPGRTWHTDRTPVLKIADWLTRLCLSLAKIGEDAIQMAQSGISEMSLGGVGASSTMPQKQNPVAPSALVALANQAHGLNSILQGASVHRHQRDGASWFTEWMTLPQIVLSTASASRIANTLSQSLTPKADTMLDPVQEGLGLIHAEALSFALAAHMPRPDAQARVKTLCAEAMATQTHLRDLVTDQHPELETAALFQATEQLGTAPTEARSFTRQVRAI
jgi:3-carboxy-cis,cis-muconate cycloisomerase